MADPGVHRVERDRKPRGDLALREPVVVGKHEGSALIEADRVQRLLDTRSLLCALKITPGLWKKNGRISFIGRSLLQMLCCPCVLTQPVQRLSSAKEHEPGEYAGPPGIVARRLPPGLEKGLLHDCLSLCGVTENSVREPVEEVSFVIEQSREGRAVAGRKAEYEIGVAVLIATGCGSLDRGDRGLSAGVCVTHRLTPGRETHLKISATNGSRNDKGMGRKDESPGPEPCLAALLVSCLRNFLAFGRRCIPQAPPPVVAKT